MLVTTYFEHISGWVWGRGWRLGGGWCSSKRGLGKQASAVALSHTILTTYLISQSLIDLPSSSLKMMLFSPSKKRPLWDFPGSPVVRTLRFDCRGGWVKSLVGKLRSCMPRGVAKEEKKKEAIAFIVVLIITAVN